MYKGTDSQAVTYVLSQLRDKTAAYSFLLMWREGTLDPDHRYFEWLEANMPDLSEKFEVPTRALARESIPKSYRAEGNNFID